MTGISPTPRNAYSFSRLKTYRQCPARYRMRYLLGLEETFRSIESHLGNVVHDVLEWLYRERDNGRTPTAEATLDELAKRWRSSWTDAVAVVRLGEEPEVHLRRGREMLHRFVTTIFPRDRSETVSLEKRMTVELDDDIVFTGFADRIGRTEAGRLFVIDYKTSKNEGDGSEFSEGLQAPLYAACALRHHDEGSALAGYHYLRHGTTRWQEVDRERAVRLLDRCRELVRQTEAADEHPARPGVLCAWCGFNDRCPEAKVPEALSGGLDHARSRA